MVLPLGLRTLFLSLFTYSFLNCLFIVALTARSYRDCRSFLFQIGIFIFTLNLSNHTWDFSLSMADICRAVSNVVTGPRTRREQSWVKVLKCDRAYLNILVDNLPVRYVTLTLRIMWITFKVVTALALMTVNKNISVVSHNERIWVRTNIYCMYDIFVTGP